MPRRWSQSETEPKLPLLDGVAIVTPPSDRDLLTAVSEYLQQRGATGATRDELALAKVAPLQSICSAVVKLLRDGKIIETTTTRRTRAGRQARVLLAAGLAAEKGDLVKTAISTKRTPPARRDLWRETQQHMEQRRQERRAEEIILRGRRAGQDDDVIRRQLAAENLTWPQ